MLKQKDRRIKGREKGETKTIVRKMKAKFNMLYRKEKKHKQEEKSMEKKGKVSAFSVDECQRI